jgi:molecular chaperone GrpE
MPEAEDALNRPPAEARTSAPPSTDADAIPPVDVESVQLLVGAPSQEVASSQWQDLAAIPGSTATGQIRESPRDSQALLEVMTALGERLDRRLEALQTLFEREQRAEAARERVVDRLHAELQEYKQDLLLKVQRPIFIDLIQLHDDIGKMIDAQPADQPEAPRASSVCALLESIQTGIEDILYRQGVEPFVRDGNDFDPRRQRALSTAPTDNPAMSKTIAARLRKGFQAGDKIIRPELVTVYALRPTV